MLHPFHFTIPVTDISAAIKYYTETIGCKLGRKSRDWVDFNFFGHQLVAHLVPAIETIISTNSVDGENVPCRHFGVIMSIDDWNNYLNKLNEKEIKYSIPPQVRFKNKIGEQNTFFLQDPFGNCLEFKAFKNNNEIFMTE